MYTRRNLLGVALGALTVSATRAFSRDLPHDLLFIHGRGQGGFNPAVLESRWMHAFKLGAQKLGRTIPSTLNVSFPFYGDALDQFAKASKVPSTAGIQTRGVAPNNQFFVFQAELAEDIRTKAGVTDREILDEYGADTQERGLLNRKWVLAILRTLDKLTGDLGQAAIEEFTWDVYLYITKAGVRDAVDAIVRAKMTGRPTVVVAHSLGSVVAYNVLRTEARNINVPLLVTLGCPLGIPAIRNQLVPLRFPKCVDTWYNAFDTRDLIALFPLDDSNFPIIPAVTNFSGVRNHTDNRHGIEGYLDDPDVAAHVLDGLVG